MKSLLKVDPRLQIVKMEEVLKEPKIIRVNKFNEESLEEFEEDLNDAQNTGQPVVPIILDSFGGGAYSLLGFIAAIEQVEKPVATILTSKAMSCGAILFSFGTDGYRFMHPDATLMIHDAAAGVFGKIKDIKNDTKHLSKMNKKVYRKMSKHLGHPSNYILDLIKEHSHVDWFLSAKQAKKRNIANHLRIPHFEVEINLSVKFI